MTETNRAGDPYGLTSLGAHGWEDVTRYDRPPAGPWRAPDSKADKLRHAARALESTREQVQRWHDAQAGLLADALGRDSEAYLLATSALQEESAKRIETARRAFRDRVAEEVSSSWQR